MTAFIYKKKSKQIENEFSESGSINWLMLYVSPTRALRTMAGCIDESGTIVFIEANFNNGYINDFFCT